MFTLFNAAVRVRKPALAVDVPFPESPFGGPQFSGFARSLMQCDQV